MTPAASPITVAWWRRRMAARGTLARPSLNSAFLVVEAILHGATLTNNKTILGAATSGGSTFVEVCRGDW